MQKILKQKYFVWAFHRLSKYLNSWRIIGCFLEHGAEFYFKISTYTSQMLPSGAVRARPSLSLSLLLLEQPWETSLEGSSSVVISLFTSTTDWFCLLEREADLKCAIHLLFPRCMMVVLYYNKWTVAKCMAFYIKKFQLIWGDKSYVVQEVFYPTVFVFLVSVKVWCFNSVTYCTHIIYGKESFHFSDWIASVDQLSVSNGSNAYPRSKTLIECNLPT